MAVHAAASTSTYPRALELPARLALVLATGMALAVAVLAAPEISASAVEPQLVTVLRAMAAIKGGLAAMAVAACFWRLARPASAWRTAVYVAAPPLMAAGTVALWNLQALGPAAFGLHLGLFAVIAAALTDPDFIVLARRSDRRR